MGYKAFSKTPQVGNKIRKSSTVIPAEGRVEKAIAYFKIYAGALPLRVLAACRAPTMAYKN
jgi:hypothetical protein